MGRWQPDAAARLSTTAMRLYAEQGYDQTTVADIAEQAGLTARTFFRYFGDKREVLFAGSAELKALMVDALAAAPATSAPLDAVAAALDASADRLGDNREWSRGRQQLIATHDDLHERELMKLSTLAAAMAEALRGRGVDEPAATLAAEVGVSSFRVAFDRWVTEPVERPLREVMRETLAQMRVVATG